MKILDRVGIKNPLLTQYLRRGWHEKAAFTKNAKQNCHKKARLTKNIRRGWLR